MKRNMSTRAPLRVLTAILLLGGLLVAPAAPAAAQQPESFVTMISDAGDYIGGGQARYYHAGNAEITLSGTTSSVNVNVSGGNLGDQFNMQFAAPQGQTLQPGVYERAQRASFREAGRPGIDISGDGRGCNTISGRFEVKEVTQVVNTITKLWIVYEQHCEGGSAALFGEVRYGVPRRPGTSVALGPSVVQWPETDAGSPTRVVPVTVVNTASSPVEIGAASVSGTDRDRFSVRLDECNGTLGPSETCFVFVRFSTATAGNRRASLTIPERGGLTHSVALSGNVAGGITRFTLAGGYVGGGRHRYTTANAEISVDGGYDGVRGWIEGTDGNWWSAEFYPPAGDVLAPGTTYRDAKRAAFRGTAAGLEVSGSGRGCNELTGSFTVLALEVGEYGDLEQVAIRYTQHCDYERHPSRGDLMFHVQPPNVYKRSIALSVQGGRLRGTVRGNNRCTARTLVRLQRYEDGIFKTFVSDRTNANGGFARKVRRGWYYRVLAPEKWLADGSLCKPAVSPARG